MRIVTKKFGQAGVTIIELMIATSVFAVILVIIMSAFLFVSKDYEKAYIESQTQTTTRSIIQQLAQDIELSAGKVVPNNPVTGAYPLVPASDGTQGICIGDYRYSVALNQEINGTTVLHALVVDNVPNCTLTTRAQAIKNTALLTATSKELLGNNMRIGTFTVIAPPDSSLPGSTIPAVPGQYLVNVSIAYGEDTSAGGPLNVKVGAGLTPYSYSCQQISLGGNFCATSSLSTYAQQRVWNQTE